MNRLRVERDTEILIDNQLVNLGWILNPNSKKRNVYLQRPKNLEDKKKLKGLRADYILYETGSNSSLAIIEAKKPGGSIKTAMDDGIKKAKRIGCPTVFATDGIYTKTYHLLTKENLILNGEEVNRLLNERSLINFVADNKVDNLNHKVIKSRGELIHIFKKVNNILREEGLQQGLDRFLEFSNILFLKLFSEIEEIRDEKGIKPRILLSHRWNSFNKKKGNELLSYVNDTVLKSFSETYKDKTIFHKLKIRHPDNLKSIIDILDKLYLTDINADIKGDAFEYFLKSYGASNPRDLGEIFTPRHIVNTVVKMVNPKIGETIYDPFCGTGGMLITAFKHISENMINNKKNIKILSEKTFYGSEITQTASIAKMNMILSGDGHSNIRRLDSFKNPVDKKFDIVITNYPFAQTTKYGDLYNIPDDNGDLISPQLCLRAVKDGGRMAFIAPDGFLSNNNSKSYKLVREHLLNNSDLEKVVSLPRGSFQPYNKAKASILYFNNIRNKKKSKYYWFFDIKNDGYTLDTKRQKIDGPNDLELVLSENNLDNQSEKFLKQNSIEKILIKNVLKNNHVLSANYYREIGKSSSKVIRIGDLLERADTVKVKNSANVPIMSITMERGLIDQKEKFKKRVASKDISKYTKVFKNQLVVGFPIDEGVLGFQKKYQFAAVSPAYKIWKLKKNINYDIELLDILLRSDPMREIYRSKMQGAVDRRRSIPDHLFEDIELPIIKKETQKKLILQIKKIKRLKQLEMRERNIFTNNINKLF
tara:strand:+ start:169 stop:2457 length:2289 start_codon:yes stop_codon:yes gene_type:complete